MPLFVSKKDISFFRKLNREIIADIISVTIVYYKIDINSTQINIYGESTNRMYEEPIELFSKISRNTPKYAQKEDIIDYNSEIRFSFLREDLKEIKLRPEIGDIIRYEDSYYEVHNVEENRKLGGRNPEYTNGNEEMNEYGELFSIAVDTHYVPADKVQITKER